MAKFKIGEIIEPVERGRGFENAEVQNIYTATRGRFKGEKMYLLKVINGTATVPIRAEDNYKLKQ